MALVGIAKMAAQSSILEAKSRVEYRDLAARRWIGRCSNPQLPFTWTINPYRGCEMACRYCYARYTHEFMELNPGDDFDTRIFAKQWSAAAFATELRRIPREESIALGTATDPYQHAERRYGLTRKMLELFAQEHGRRLYITTKSDLIRRDADLFTEIARRNHLSISVTVTTMDAELARALEPMAPRPDLRMRAVRHLNTLGIRANVGASPVMPGINDSFASLDRVARAAYDAGARCFHANVLFLKPSTLPVFLDFLSTRFPDLLSAYRRLYARDAYLRGAYPEEVRQRVEQIRARYGLTGRETTPAPVENYAPQLPLFAA
jgi:DNA repair photolyase